MRARRLRKSPPVVRRRCRSIVAPLLLLGVSTLLPGRTLTVDDNGPADFAKIQLAIDAAVAGDVVSVAPGTYLENLTLKSGVSVVGAGTDVTTVDGGALSYVAQILNCDATTLLRGFTLTNGLQQFGAGVHVVGGGPLIDSNRIVSNTAAPIRFGYGEGGGIFLQNSQAMVSNNVISGNKADNGAGLQVVGGSPVITRNQITGNAAAVSGGGIYLYSSPGAAVTGNSILLNSATYYGGAVEVYKGAPILSNNLMTGNTAISTVPQAYAFGGGVDVSYSSAILINNTLADNKADVGGGVEIFVLSTTRPGLVNNIIYNNTGVSDSGGVDVVAPAADILYNILFSNSHNDCGGPGAGLCADPTNLFVDPRFVDARRSDYRLLPDSPAIDSGASAGAPPDDLRGQRRPLDGNGDRIAAVDRGAYEFDRNDIFGLRFSSATTLTWLAASGASSYHVYSGALATLATRGTDTCRDADDPSLTDLVFPESGSPLPGGGSAYVVTAVIGGVEQSPGFDSHGLERTLVAACP